MNMLDTNSKIREATCKEVAAWMAEVFWDMVGKIMLKNAWWKIGYNWFEGAVEEDVVVEDVDDNDDGNKANNIGDEDNNNKDVDVFSNGNDNKEEWEEGEEDGA